MSYENSMKGKLSILLGKIQFKMMLSAFWKRDGNSQNSRLEISRNKFVDQINKNPQYSVEQSKELQKPNLTVL